MDDSLGFLLIDGDTVNDSSPPSCSALGLGVNHEGRSEGQKEGLFVFETLGSLDGLFNSLVGIVGKKLVLGFSLGQLDGK